MKNKSQSVFNFSRRKFLKASSFATFGLITSSFVKNVFTRSLGYINGMQINPEIDNLRVVACCDPLMEKSSPLKWDTVTQNSVVDSARVSDTLDKMAKALAQKTDIWDAWKTIFKKPASKDWQNIRAAIKVNCAGNMHPRAAIIDKICRVLNTLGVPFSNIIVYDAVDNAIAYYSNFIGTLLPSGIYVSNATDTFPITVMGENLKCTSIIQDIDILVNIGTNKPHISTWAGITMCCKNHVGTITRSTPGNNCPQNLIQLFEINKHEAIIGNLSQDIPAKQQLCIVDSLWSSTTGDWSSIPNKAVYYLVMGTFAPAVDYLTTKKIREEIMKCSHPLDINNFITYFGYSEEERIDLTTLTPDKNYGRGWVEVPVSGAINNFCSLEKNNIAFKFIIQNKNGKQNILDIFFPPNDTIIDTYICLANGRIVKSFGAIKKDRYYWDGCISSNLKLTSGNYYLILKGKKTSKAFHFNLI
jgi:hypothetical protein